MNIILTVTNCTSLDDANITWIDGRKKCLGCLGFAKTNMTSNDAQKFCTKNRGSHLVEIFTRNQLDFIRLEAFKLRTRGSFWIGLKRVEGLIWKWAHSGKAFDITLWPKSQPNNGKDGDPFAILCGNQPYDYEIFDIYTTPWDFKKSYNYKTEVYPLCQIQ